MEGTLLKDINVNDLPAPHELSADSLPSPSELGHSPVASQPQSQPTPEEQISQAEALARGTVQGATAGFSDELIGGAGVVLNPGEVLQADDKIEKMKELFSRYRDIERQRNKLAEEAYGKTYLAGNVLGGIATLPATSSVKGATLLGAVTGLGSSEAESTGELIKDTAIGGAIGGAAGKVGQVASELLSPSALKQSAAENLANVAGVKGLPSARQKVGEALLESGALKGGIKEEALGSITQAAQKAEETLQPALQSVKNKLATMPAEDVSAAVGGDAGDKVYGLLQNAIDGMKDMSSDVEAEFASTIAPKVQDYILKLKEAGNDPVRLNELKRAAYKQAEDIYSQIRKMQQTQSPVPKAFEDWGMMAKQIGETVKDHIEQLAGVASSGVEAGSGSSLLDIIRNSNYQLGGLAGAKRAVTSKLSKGADSFKTSSTMEYAYHPKWALIKDVVKNLGSDAVRGEKAAAEAKLAGLLEKTVGEKLSPIAEQIGKRTTSSTPVIEKAQQITGSQQRSSSDFDRDTPATVSQSLYAQSDDQLKQLADDLSTQPGLDHSGAALNKALATKNIASKNSILFSLAQNPQARRVLIQRGLIKKSE